MAWPGFLWLALVVLPLVCASAIPSDRQYKVQELLASTPITGWSYLAGKILGTWAVIAVFGLLALLVHIGLLTALVGPIDWPLYIQLTLLCGLPLTFWSSAMGVLAGSGLRSRRLAHLTGLLVGLLSIVPSGLAFRDPVNLDRIFVPFFPTRDTNDGIHGFAYPPGHLGLRLPTIPSDYARIGSHPLPKPRSSCF